MQSPELTQPLNTKELLHQIINRAKQSGYCFRNLLDDYDSFSITSFNQESGRMVVVLKSQAKLQLIYDSVYLLFFDINFAKAIFGENWEDHLIALAEADDKILYLANHINLKNYESRRITG
jgi:hypothetical protein